MNLNHPSPSDVFRHGVVAVIERDGRFLTITRSATVVAPGKVCFPGGGIEPGETPAEALVRECFEELELRVRPLKQLSESITPWNVHLRWWAADIDVDATPVPNPKEVAAVQWLSLQELIDHPETLESNRPFFEELKSVADEKKNVR